MYKCPKPGTCQVIVNEFDAIHNNPAPFTRGGSNTDKPTEPKIRKIILFSSLSSLRDLHHCSLFRICPHSELESPRSSLLHPHQNGCSKQTPQTEIYSSLPSFYHNFNILVLCAWVCKMKMFVKKSFSQYLSDNRLDVISVPGLSVF